MTTVFEKMPAIIKRGEKDFPALLDAFDLCKHLEQEKAVTVYAMKKGERDEKIFDPDNFRLAHEYAKQIRRLSAISISNGGGQSALDLNKACLLFDAPYDFDAAIRYMEWDRPERRKFYEPRRKQLFPVVQALQELADDKLDLLGISLPPGTGKTTLALFFICWSAGRNPELQILGSSHNNEFLRGAYDECLRILEKDGEYLWCDIFPDVKLVGTNAKNYRIDLGSRKRFETIEFSSIGSGNAGKIRATNFLYCDDLVPGIETALSIEQLNKLWREYTDDLRQRKQGDRVKELHIATRWSVHDVLGRLENAYGGSDRAKFLRFPALDANDESNFDYPYGLGFSTADFREQRTLMDDASFKAIYQAEPIEREGQLYAPDEIRRYYSLPDREPDAVIAICDTKNKGMDYCVVPVAYQYGTDFYIEGFVCDNGKPELVDEKVCQLLVKYRVQMAQFESNNAGGRIADNIQKRVKELGGITQITTKWNQQNKETRILVASAYAKEHFLFKADDVIGEDKDYREALRLLFTYSMIGKNQHDDVPDALAALVNYVQTFTIQTCQVLYRPF